MSIDSNALKQFFEAGVGQELSDPGATTGVVATTFSLAAELRDLVNTDDVPYATFVLHAAAGFTAASIVAGETISLILQPKDLYGQAAENAPVPEQPGGNYLVHKVGDFTIADPALDTDPQFLTLVVDLHPFMVNTAQVWQPWLLNNSAGASLLATWKLFQQFKTYGPKA